MTAEYIIDAKSIKKVYGMDNVQISALDGVDIQVSSGEFVAIMGPSGSGKSTLMNILGCLDRPTEGEYLLDGQDVSHHSREQLAYIRNQKIGFVFQSYNLLPRFTAAENVMVPLLYNHSNRHNARQRLEKAEEKLASVGLAERFIHLPRELSGGEQQRVAIARALVNDPVLILADEPTGNLDSKAGLEIMDILHTLNKNGSTIVMVTHDHEIAEQTQRTIFLRDGKIETDHHNGHHQEGER
jgi:putative ABC transport system ATP-binding protein